MTDQEAFKQFAERIGRTEEPYRESFREVWLDLIAPPYKAGFSEQEALDLLVEWYQDERKDGNFRTPLQVIETFRRPRAWTIFLCWSHHGQPWTARGGRSST